ncbi:hypothetical protein [Pannonibacter phragmitetus]|uniref:hypothetical protein n=1 Tax=Pannonibacter phragmitetus TaxID=121719 RepID=UPI003D2EE313
MDGVVKQLSEAKQASDTLKNSASQSDNNKRADKIAQIEQKIESLKQRLKFATPAQARALIRELKELGKEFKEAAQSLSSGGGGASAAMTGATAIPVTAAAGTSAVAGATGAGGTGAQTAGVGANSAAQSAAGGTGAAVSQAQGADAGAAQTQANQTSNAQPAVDAGGEGDATASATGETQQASSETDDADATAGAEAIAGNEDDGKALALQTSMREAIAGYTAAKPSDQDKAERKQAADRAAADAAIKSGDHDKLSKLKKEIDLIAKQIEALADKDDPEQRRELEKAKRELAEGQKALDGYVLERLRNSELAGGGEDEADAEAGTGGIAPDDGAADVAVSDAQAPAGPVGAVTPGPSVSGGVGMPVMALSVPLTLNLRTDVTV